MANEMPWSKFYWSDWITDPNLKRCSKAAKGFWMDCMGTMYQCEERGVFASNGKAWPDSDIAFAVEGDPAENLQLLRELEDKGVLSRNGIGAVYSRRIVRDEQVRLARSDAGSKGGSKAQANRQAKVQQTLSGSVSDSSEGGNAKGGAIRFDGFWAAYPRKVGKAAAKRYWSRNGLDNTADAIMAGLERCKASKAWSKDGGQFVPHPTTWLNRDGWEDEIDGKPIGPARGSLASLDHATEARLWKVACEADPDLRAQGRGSDAARKAIAKLARSEAA